MIATEVSAGRTAATLAAIDRALVEVPDPFAGAPELTDAEYDRLWDLVTPAGYRGDFGFETPPYPEEYIDWAVGCSPLDIRLVFLATDLRARLERQRSSP